MRYALCLIATASAALALGGSASPAAAQRNTDNCFRMSMLSSTRPDGDKTIYARVGVSGFYRIDLAHRCASLPYEGNFLVLTPTPGQDLICGPLDLDLKVNDHGANEPCFIKSITHLTPDQVAKIPRKAKP
jgi:hypothetical protein